LHAGARVTVRQALNHSAGWLGDDFENTGAGDDALARYVAGMARLPQLTPPGSAFSYSNSALSLAGRLIEVAAGTTYEGRYTAQELDPTGELTPKRLELRADRGHVLQLDPDGTPSGIRADFIRGGDGRIMWLWIGGRLCRHD
jgi:hypothetical protein